MVVVGFSGFLAVFKKPEKPTTTIELNSHITNWVFFYVQSMWLCLLSPAWLLLCFQTLTVRVVIHLCMPALVLDLLASGLLSILVFYYSLPQNWSRKICLCNLFGLLLTYSIALWPKVKDCGHSFPVTWGGRVSLWASNFFSNKLGASFKQRQNLFKSTFW